MRRSRILILASALAVASLGMSAGPAAADDDSTASICASLQVTVNGDDVIAEDDCLEL